MTFESTKPVDFDQMGNFDKDIWIENIIEMCDDLEANDVLRVYGYGKKSDMLLDIYKDEDFKRDEEDEFNLVVIHTSRMQDGYLTSIDDTEDTHVLDGSLENELNRIWEHKELSLAA